MGVGKKHLLYLKVLQQIVNYFDGEQNLNIIIKLHGYVVINTTSTG